MGGTEGPRRVALVSGATEGIGGPALPLEPIAG
jgi:hypothetical protein